MGYIIPKELQREYSCVNYVNYLLIGMFSCNQIIIIGKVMIQHDTRDGYLSESSLFRKRKGSLI